MINKHIVNLKPYIPISHKAWDIKDKSHALKLDWNESTIAPSPAIIKALKDFIDRGLLHWYPNTRAQDLYDSLANYAGTNTKEIEIFAGSDCAHEFILQVFLDQGSKLMIVSPTYDNFRARAQGIGVELILFHTNTDFSMDFNTLEREINRHNPMMIYICNPNNPTGRMYDNDKLKDIITKYDRIMFAIDEAYYEFCNETLATLIHDNKNIIIIRTFSKAFGLAGLRIGYCISNEYNINYLNKLRNAKSISSLAQIATIHALKDIEYMQRYTKEVKHAREWFAIELEKLGIQHIPSHANFVFIQHDANLYHILEQHNIFIRDYRHIIPNHFRITIGTLEQMQQVVNILRISL